MSVERYSIDTRRSDFAAIADLTRGDDMIAVMRFEISETILPGSPIGLVLHASLLSADDIGWLKDGSLLRQAPANPGDVVVLAVRSDALRRALAERHATVGEPANAAEIVFSTTVAYPRGTQASGRRRLTLQPLVSAAAPAIDLATQTLDLSNLSSVGPVQVGSLAIAVPPDLALLDDPALTISFALEGADGAMLTLQAQPVWSSALALERTEGADTRLSTWRISIRDVALVSGETISLSIGLTGPGLLSLIDAHFDRNPDAETTLVLTASLTGWITQVRSGSTNRLWRINAPDCVVRLLGARSGVATISAGGVVTPWQLSSAEMVMLLPSLQARYDIDLPRRSLRMPELSVMIGGWPVARQPVLAMHIALVLDNGMRQEQRDTVTLALSADTGARQGRFTVPLDLMTNDIIRLLEAGEGAAETLAEVTISLSSVDGNDTAELRIRAPLTIRPQPRRALLCIDFGERAIAAWCSTETESGATSRLQLADFGLGSGDVSHLLPGSIELGDGPGVLDDASILPLSQPPDGRVGLRFSTALLGGRGVKSRLLKRGFVQRGGGGQIDPRRPVEVAADALTELVAQRLTPLFPELRRPDDMRTQLVPKIVLTHPAGLGGDAAAAYAGLVDLLGARLEPWFPGSVEVDDLVGLVSEAVAAGRFASSRIQPDDIDQLIAIDVGASSVNVAVLDMTTGQLAPLLAFSLPLGADAILSAVVAVVVEHLIAASAQIDLEWASICPVSLLHDGQPGAQPARRHAIEVLTTLVADEQHRLAAAAARQATAKAVSYSWPEGDDGIMTLTLGHVLDPTSAPPSDMSDLTSPLFLPRGPVAHEGGDVAPGVAWRVTDNGRRALQLRIHPEGLTSAGEASRRLDAVIHALSVTVPRMARSGAPTGQVRPRRAVFLTGRGALWPTLYAAIETQTVAAGDTMALPRPLTPEQMKLAVSAGAALIAAENALGLSQPRHDMPIALAVMAAKVFDGAELAASTTFVVERLFYLTRAMGGGGRAYEAETPEQQSLSGRINLGRRFAFVRCAPGLDPQGRVIAELRSVTGSEPVRVIAGDATVDAATAGLGAFGPCDIVTEDIGGGRLKVSVTAIDAGWVSTWMISDDTVALLAGGEP
jgi:hypothetical protein